MKFRKITEFDSPIFYGNGDVSMKKSRELHRQIKELEELNCGKQQGGRGCFGTDKEYIKELEFENIMEKRRKVLIKSIRNALDM